MASDFRDGRSILDTLVEPASASSRLEKFLQCRWSLKTNLLVRVEQNEDLLGDIADCCDAGPFTSVIHAIADVKLICQGSTHTSDVRSIY